MGATNRRLAGFFTTTNLIDFAHRRYHNWWLSSQSNQKETPPPLLEAGPQQQFHNALPWLKVETAIKITENHYIWHQRNQEY